jgi:hypothetical protein
MSESQFTRIEKALISLESSKATLEATKRWFRNSAIILFAASFLMRGSVARSEYRTGKTEADIEIIRGQAASIKSVELLVDSFKNTTDALLTLVDDKHKEAAEEFIKQSQKINSNIFVYSTMITRGNNQNISK